MKINLTPTQIGTIYEEVEATAALPAYATTVYDPTANDSVAQYVQMDDARVHTSGKKLEGNDTVTPLDVKVRSIYKLLTFDDSLQGNALVEEIIRQLPAVIAKAIDQLPAGYLLDQSGNVVPTVITKEETVDGTAASWMGVVDAQQKDHFGINGWVLDQSAVPLLRQANTNDFTTLGTADLPAGFRVGGAPFSFRDNFAKGDELGYALSKAGSRLVIQPSIKLRVFNPEDNWELQQLNQIGVYAGIRAGFAALPGAARRIVDGSAA